MTMLEFSTEPLTLEFLNMYRCIDDSVFILLDTQVQEQIKSVAVYNKFGYWIKSIDPIIDIWPGLDALAQYHNNSGYEDIMLHKEDFYNASP